MVAMIVVDAHTSVAKGQIQGFRRVIIAQRPDNLWVTEEVKRPSGYPASAMSLRLKSPFSLVDDSYQIAEGGHRDGGRFAVTE